MQTVRCPQFYPSPLALPDRVHARADFKPTVKIDNEAALPAYMESATSVRRCYWNSINGKCGTASNAGALKCGPEAPPPPSPMPTFPDSIDDPPSGQVNISDYVCSASDVNSGDVYSSEAWCRGFATALLMDSVSPTHVADYRVVEGVAARQTRCSVRLARQTGAQAAVLHTGRPPRSHAAALIRGSGDERSGHGCREWWPHRRRPRCSMHRRARRRTT